jgi:uncharacterized delta-60 repeat protein
MFEFLERTSIPGRMLGVATMLVCLVVPAVARGGAATLDQGFGNGGIVTTDVHGQGAVEALYVLPGGLILAGGTNDDQAVLGCYTPGGVLDTSFGGGIDGLVTPHQGAIEAIVRQGDGRLVTAGGTGFKLARYSGFGVLEPPVHPFTSDGNSSLFWAYDMVLPGDGSFIVLGEGYTSGCALLRFTSALALDDSFGSASGAQASLGACRALVRDPSTGQLYVTAARDPIGNAGFGLARFTAAGALDGGFGAGGVSFVPRSDNFALPRGMVRQPDGKIIVVGSWGAGVGSNPKAGLVARFNADGTLDPQFGPVGGGITLFGDSSGTFAFTAEAVVVQDDGRIIVGGNVKGPSNVRDGAGPGAFVIIRFLSTGQYDVAFGDDPSGTLAFTPFGSGVSAELHTMALQPDGKLLVAGYATTGEGGQRQFALARYDVSGASVAGSPGGVDVDGGGNGGGASVGLGGNTTPCTGASGVESFRCLCARGIAVASCAGQSVPAGVGNDLRKACGFVDRAATSKKAAQRKLFRRATTELKSAAAIVRRQKSRKRLKGACPDDLKAVLSNGQSLVGVIRSGG